MASNFSSSNNVLGVRKTTDFIEKATWGLAIAMVVFSVVCAYVAPSANTDQSVIERAAEQLFNPNNLPNFGASQQKQAAPAQKGGAQGAAQGAPAQGRRPHSKRSYHKLSYPPVFQGRGLVGFAPTDPARSIVLHVPILCFHAGSPLF